MTTPVLRHVVRFLNTLDGRDQSAKFLQYGSRAAMYYTALNSADSVLSKRFQRTYKGASTGRKLFRLLKWLKEYQAAIDACSTKNELLRSLRILQHICLAVYLCADNAVWFGKNKVFEFDVKTLGQRASVFWTVGLSTTLAADLLQIKQLLAVKQQTEAFLRGDTKPVDDGWEEMKNEEAAKQLQAIDAKLFKLYLSVIKVIPSIIVAANSAAWIERLRGSKVSDGIIGLCGMIASSTNIYKAWKATS